MTLTEKFPLNSTVKTTIYAINDRSEVATGTVVDYKYGHVIVQTEWWGTIAVEPDKAELIEEGNDHE